MSKASVSDSAVGSPPRSRATFFLPPRPGKSLDAAHIRIRVKDTNGSKSRARVQEAISKR